MKSPGLITRALAEPTPARMLRAFIDGVSAREDVRVLTKKIGDPAPPALVQALRGELPDDLLDFFAEMNGAELRFTLIPDDAPIDGFEIDPLRDWTGFNEREEIEQDGQGTGVYLDDFGGPNVLHLLFDNMQNERPLHYVKRRDAPANAARLVFDPRRADRRVTVAKSLDEYFRRGIARAFAEAWPVEGAAGKKIAARLEAPPRPPSTLGPGARVISNRPNCCWPNDRATVVRVDEAPVVPDKVPGPYVPEPWQWGIELVLLTFDQGPTCYVPRDSVALIKKTDLYESARQDPTAFLESLRDASPDDAAVIVARLGITNVYCGLRGDLSVPMTAPRLFALLQRAPRALVVDVLVDRLEAWFANGDAHVHYFTRALKLNRTEYEQRARKDYAVSQVIDVVAGAFGIWCWWLVQEQSVTSLGAELPAGALARLGALAAAMEHTHVGRNAARFLALVARGGPLPAYPPQDGGTLVFGTTTGTRASLSPGSSVPASAFGLPSEHRVYWR